MRLLERLWKQDDIVAVMHTGLATTSRAGESGMEAAIQWKPKAKSAVVACLELKMHQRRKSGFQVSERDTAEVLERVCT